MFIHVKIGVTGIGSWLSENKTREEALTEYACPYINREITLHDKRLFNMSSYGSLKFYKTEKPVDSDWPVKKADFEKDKLWNYQDAILEELETSGEDITEEIYKEALVLLESGKYRETRKSLLEQEKGRYCFFVCPMGNDEVDHNYEYVIKPTVGRYQFTIQRADEISHTRAITDVIVGAINRSRFVVADLTDERPSCYYEVGYAHSLGKPVIILAKEGITRHFDISHYKWNYWIDYRDLKPKFEKEVVGVLRELGITQ